jgi:predicted extracellular nuclease
VSHPAVLRSPAVALAAVLAVLATVLVAATPARAASSGLVLSRVYGGGGNAGAPFTNDYIEIFNRGSSPVPLSGLSLQYASATGTGNFGATTTAITELPAASVPAGGYYLVQEGAGTTPSGAITPDFADLTPINLSGTAGKVALVTGTGTLGCNGGSAACDAAATGRIIDLIGFGNANYFEGPAAAPTLSNTTDARRKDNGCTDTDNNGNDFDAAVPAPRNSATDLNPCGVVGDAAPKVSSTAPADGANNIAVASPVTITFSEPVDTTGDWFSISCASSGNHTATVTASADGTSRELNPDEDFADNENCTVTVSAAGVTDQDAVDPPDNLVSDVSVTFPTVESNPCDSPFTPIHDIQGSGSTSAAAGQTRSTEGVVTGDFQGASGMNGFFIQDATPDSDPLTSEGVFVFVPAASPFFSMAVNPGDTVHLRGRVTEFQNQTEIDTLNQLVVCSAGTDIAATEVTLPETTNGDLERYEGMKVTLPQTLTVEQNFFQGRFGQLTLGYGGRLYQPTNKFPAGSPEAQALADKNNRSMIVLDDAVSAQNRDPVPFLGAGNIRRAGDTVSGIAGILDEGAINSVTTIRDYRVQITRQPTFSQDNKRTAAPTEVGGNLKVASFNVLNYFRTLTSQDPDARGADTAEERDRQGTKIWSAMKAIDADVFGLMEIENRPNPDAAAAFVEGLNQYIVDHGGPANSYTAVPNPATGTGDDFIKVAMIYKAAKVTPVGGSMSDVDELNDRAPIAQTFALNANGEKFSVVVNHFKSKGSCPSGTGADADNGDGQGCWNARRVLQAQRLLTFIDTVTTAAGDDDALVIGDLNSYGKEDPILALQAGGLKNEIDRFIGPGAYSYVFDGLSGYLDHGLATESADHQVVGATEWHINADEPSIIDYNTEFKSPGQVEGLYSPDPYRSSDHDPVVLGLDLGGCTFTDDTRHHVRSLDGDCTTSSTIKVPNGWTLDGHGHTITAYDPAGGHFRGAVVANAGAVANVLNLRVTGYHLADVCDAGADALRGILLDGASGVLDSNHVVGLRQEGSGCQEGNGIDVRNAPFAKRGRDVYVAVTRNEVRGYQKTGIVVNGSVLALVHGNTVQGLGKVPYIAQNGVQVGFAGTGIVSGNRITDNYYTGTADAQACGVLFFQDDRASQLGNTFAGNQRNVCTGSSAIG